jgi:methylated-DNA-[protein]-cysteine S-methyltransferase
VRCTIGAESVETIMHGETARRSACPVIQGELIAAAAGEAPPLVTRQVEAHVAICAICRQSYDAYCDIERMVGELKRMPAPPGHLALLREELATRMAELRRRLIRYQIFASPLGRILIGASEQGVVLVDYLEGPDGPQASRLDRLRGVEATEDGAELEPLYRQLLEYLDGQRQHLGWPLDLRLAGSDFQREVLQATAELPYGAVTSYGRIARQLGNPAAVRAVAQALRGNPLPIAVPCHRVVGSGGGLTGYAGNNLALKVRLLTLEGVPLAQEHGVPCVRRAGMYVRAGWDHAYCLPTCGALESLTLARLTLYASRECAEACGLRPCRSCRPDLSRPAAWGRSRPSAGCATRASACSVARLS